MKIHEYQGKELLKKFNVPWCPRQRGHDLPGSPPGGKNWPRARLWSRPRLTPGAGAMGGGIKVATTFEAVEQMADQILGMTLVTPQTGPEGKVVQ